MKVYALSLYFSRWHIKIVHEFVSAPEIQFDNVNKKSENEENDDDNDNETPKGGKMVGLRLYSDEK